MTILYRDERFQQHRTGAHPESPARLQAIDRVLIERGLLGRCAVGTVRAALDDELLRLHPREHLAAITTLAAQGGGRIEADTVVSPESPMVARLAAGTALAAVDAVLSGVDRTAVALVRPPGHHALADKPMGFCLYANIALAAEQALRVHDLERVLIVDWDVHHGNGTQDLFYDRDDVAFFSMHRSPFYPGTGDADETGRGRGLGWTWNLPLKFGTDRRTILDGFTRQLEAAAQKARPQLVLISAGFDAHRLDPIGSLELETEDFITLTERVQAVAAVHCGGRIVSLLEGGYHLDALAASTAVHIETLLKTT